VGKSVYVTTTLQQMGFLNEDAYATPPLPPIDFYRVLGIALIFIPWVPIALLIWILT
jgi:hypothetical protein